jgi:hypothetical protein
MTSTILPPSFLTGSWPSYPKKLAFTAMKTKLKPTSQMTEPELVAYLKVQFAAEDVFTGVLGNKNSFFIAKPVRRRQAAVRGKAKVLS